MASQYSYKHYMTFHMLIIVTFLLHNIVIVNGYPNNWKNIQSGDDTTQNSLTNNINRNNKKSSVSSFMSRGWAAGGMPFNVLYLSQPPPTRMNGLSSASTLTSFNNKIVSNQKYNHLKPNEILNHTPRYAPSTAAGGTRKNTFRKSYSVIPQLFVSHGWGPLGRK